MATEEDQAKSEAAIAAPGTIVLGGRTFVCRPPSPTDYAAWRAEMRRQVQADMADPVQVCNREIAEAEKSGNPFSPTMVNGMIAVAMASKTSKAKKVEPSNDQIAEQTQTVDGARWWVWYIVHKADASVTLEWVKQVAPTTEEIFPAANAIAELSKLEKLAPN